MISLWPPPERLLAYRAKPVIFLVAPHARLRDAVVEVVLKVVPDRGVHAVLADAHVDQLLKHEQRGAWFLVEDRYLVAESKPLLLSLDVVGNRFAAVNVLQSRTQ